MASRMAIYKVQILVLVFREDLATGAGSVMPSAECVGGGVISGRMVERASGSLRVRNNEDDCRYVLET